MFCTVTAVPSDHPTTLLQATTGPEANAPGANLSNQVMVNLDHVLYAENVVDAAFDPEAYTRLHFTNGKTLDITNTMHSLLGVPR